MCPSVYWLVCSGRTLVAVTLHLLYTLCSRLWHYSAF